MSMQEDESTRGTAALQAFTEAAERGTATARQRLAGVGVNLGDADHGYRFDISSADRNTLTREGMQATDRALTTMSQEHLSRPTTVDELAGVVEDLAANPWHTGATRANVQEWVNWQLEEAHEVAGGSDAIAEELDSLETRGVARAVQQINLENDRESVAAAVASVPARSAVAASQAAPAAAAVRGTSTTQAARQSGPTTHGQSAQER